MLSLASGLSWAGADFNENQLKQRLGRTKISGLFQLIRHHQSLSLPPLLHLPSSSPAPPPHPPTPGPPARKNDSAEKVKATNVLKYIFGANSSKALWDSLRCLFQPILTPSQLIFNSKIITILSNDPFFPGYPNVVHFDERTDFLAQF